VRLQKSQDETFGAGVKLKIIISGYSISQFVFCDSSTLSCTEIIQDPTWCIKKEMAETHDIVSFEVFRTVKMFRQ
jgi:hypothetical protein